MLIRNSSPAFSNPVHLHFGAWYQALSAGVADMSFATAHPSLIRYLDMHAARLGERLAWYPADFSWARDAGDSYDYYLVCAPEDSAARLFKDHVAAVELVVQQGPWWLYRNVASKP